MRHCTICKKNCDESEVKHGVRHYAHFSCYLSEGRSLLDLPAWKIMQFPAMVLKKFGHLNPDLTFKDEEIRRKIAAEEASR